MSQAEFRFQISDFRLIRRGLLRVGEYWLLTLDGDQLARGLFDRHYSRRRYADGRAPLLFVGPGEKTVLITPAADAVFRNESPVVSSLLILDAEKVAARRWPRERLYTYVNPTAIRSTNPGACFKHAGWRACGTTKGGLVILEKCAEVPL